jgi:DNA-binding response OmpR family regulator/nitrogen-specific signal transduction histidine kinase
LVRFRDLKQNEVRLLKVEKEQTEKLSQFKIRFFTNISHEFRTPLTLLLPLVERLNSFNNMPKEAQSYLQLVKKNTFRLLNLVDELLEFRKIEQGQMILKLKKADIIGFIKEITVPFDGVAKLKNIDFLIDCERPSYEMLFDPGAMEKILSNLLSNAFKFTDTDGRIELSIRIIFAIEKNKQLTLSAEGEEYLEINVKDNGKGIANESLPHIFERYYQGKTDEFVNQNGIGIGLDLTKSLVDLHHSRISVESSEGNGSVFTVLIPADEKYYIKDILSTSPLNIEKYVIDFDSALISKIPENGNNSNESGKSLVSGNSILVIDDDLEIRELLRKILSDEYHVHTAIDGIEGAVIADRYLPDLIVCDVLMPGLDGIKFCNKIKSEFKTSHIPIILLSAGATLDHKIEGLESGADSYIAKPFHTKQLKTEIANLIKSRQKLREHFRTDIYLEPKGLNIPSVDEKFITKCIEVIELNLSESNFSVAELSKEMGLSRTQLFRKLKALLGQTPLEFIYSTRLKRAARLLTEKHFQVSEVAYMTGFSSPASFSTSFRRYFGNSPSHYQQENIVKS